MANERVKYTDASDEVSYVSIPLNDATGGAARATVLATLAGLTIGTQGQANFVTSVEDQVDNLSLPANQFAQRETKWLVTFTDDVNGRIGQFEIPTADLSLLTVGSDQIDYTDQAVIDFIAAIDANGVSRDGNAITVATIEHVGRNL